MEDDLYDRGLSLTLFLVHLASDTEQNAPMASEA